MAANTHTISRDANRRESARISGALDDAFALAPACVRVMAGRRVCGDLQPGSVRPAARQVAKDRHGVVKRDRAALALVLNVTQWCP